MANRRTFIGGWGGGVVQEQDNPHPVNACELPDMQMSINWGVTLTLRSCCVQN